MANTSFIPHCQFLSTSLSSLPLPLSFTCAFKRDGKNITGFLICKIKTISIHCLCLLILGEQTPECTNEVILKCSSLEWQGDHRDHRELLSMRSP